MTDFSRELTRLMDTRGAGVRQLARLVPCNPGHLSNLRAGKANPSFKLAKVLDGLLQADGALAGLAETAAPVVPGGELGLIELARRAQASDVGDGPVEVLQASADRLCRDYPVADPTMLSGAARTRLAYATGLLGKRVTLTQHRDLLVAAGWLSALLACSLYDAGDRSAAETARIMTRQFADHAGHGELAAWSFEIAAWYALTEGRYERAAQLSEAGLEHAGISNAAVQLTLQAARAYARMGDRQATGMLKTGKAILAKLPVPDHPEHHFVFDRDKYEFYTATVYTWLGSDDKAAEENAREVIARSPAGQAYPMRVSNAMIDLAIITGRRGDLDEAVALGRLALASQRRSAQLLPRAAELGRALAASYGQEQLISDYAEHIRAELHALP